MSLRSLHSARRVLLFDSGVGGLSIAAELLRHNSTLELITTLDYGGFPYGQQSEAALLDRLNNWLPKLAAQIRPELVVLACNSASTIALPALRQKIPQPIVGVVPAIKPAAAITQTGVIGLLATPGTVRRSYTDQLIADFAPHCEVIRVGCDRLATMAEQQIEGVAIPAEQWRDTLNPLFNHPRFNELDTLILGCTHFPLVRQQLAKHLDIPYWVDSGEAIARRVNELLGGSRDAITRRPAEHRAVLIGRPQPSEGLQHYLSEMGIKRWECID